MSAKSDESRRADAEAGVTTAAERALAEAAARRAERMPQKPREINGRNGPEPTRYGDWEVRGLATDF